MVRPREKKNTHMCGGGGGAIVVVGGGYYDVFNKYK